MLDESDGFDLELEEDAGCETGVLFEGASIVCDGVLVRVEWSRSGGDVGRGDDAHEVLVGRKV